MAWPTALVIARHGDYYGPIVNLAARLADIAVSGEVLADAARRPTWPPPGATRSSPPAGGSSRASPTRCGSCPSAGRLTDRLTRQTESAHRREGPIGGAGGETGGIRVLLVEDEVGLADAIVRGLGAEGFEVEAVHDGLEGLARARAHRYAAIVLDIMLPGRNGYQVCRDLRAEGNWTPILMLTAKDGEWDEAEALDTGADDFLSKPFSFVVLVARLRALQRRGTGPRPAVLDVGDLHLDPPTARVPSRR